MDPRLEEMGAFFSARCDTYDEVHTGHIDGGIESKRVLAQYLPENCRELLDLGVGTGLELEAVFERFPDIRVTGIDLSKKMLGLLSAKYPKRDLDLHCMSYFDFAMGESAYDCAMTVMTLHHYTHEVKTELYRRIRRSLRKNGIYIECDYMIAAKDNGDPQATEDFFFAEYERLKREQGLYDLKEYHYDTPCTLENQMKMLYNAGFSSVKKVWQIENTVVLVAEK